MEKSTERETKKPEIKTSQELDIKNLETESLLSETEKSTEPETKKPEMKQRPSTLSYSQPSLEQIIVQVEPDPPTGLESNHSKIPNKSRIEDFKPANYDEIPHSKEIFI